MKKIFKAFILSFLTIIASLILVSILKNGVVTILSLFILFVEDILFTIVTLLLMTLSLILLFNLLEERKK